MHFGNIYICLTKRTIRYSNFAKIHKALRVIPAMEEGLTKGVMTIEEIVRLAD